MTLKCSPRFGRAVRSLLGTGDAPALNIDDFRQMAVRESALVLGFNGTSPELPGEQKLVTKSTLESTIAGEPKDRLIVLHCG